MVGQATEFDEHINPTKPTRQLWCGLTVAMFFCLRISELLALTLHDIKICDTAPDTTLSIVIRSSKTDQEHLGVTRTLRMNHTDCCPAKAMIEYLKCFNDTDTQQHLFPPRFRFRLTQSMKWAASAHNVPIDVINTHSLRAGGATALFNAGENWITIQRWGRWKSYIFHEYIWEDNSSFVHLGERIALSHSHTEHLVALAPQHQRPPKENVPLFHSGGYNGEPPLIRIGTHAGWRMSFPPLCLLFVWERDMAQGWLNCANRLLITQT